MNRLLFALSIAFCSLFVLGGEKAWGQTQRQVQRLRVLAEEASEDWRAQYRRAVDLAEKRGLPVRRTLENGRVVALQRFEEGRPVYLTTYNRGGAETSSVDALWPGGSIGLSLTGDSRTMGIWDGGEVRGTHQEFGNRVTQKDDASTLSGHATHVAGTMGATGVRSEARGMAYEASLDAYDFSNDFSEMSSAAAEGLRVSNHSYGQITGWSYNPNRDPQWTWFGDPAISETEDYQFGYYGEVAADWDKLIRNAPRYLVVKSAGNDQLQGPTNQPVEHYAFDEEGNRITSTKVRDLDGGPNGYESLGRRSTAKNILTVGAVEGTGGEYSGPSDVNMSSFSSWGPTDDGRLKPDLVAKGVEVFSAYSGSDTDYNTLSGTSMSSPVTSGAVALLQEQYQVQYGADPWASTLKALLIHTADEAGNEGPDYKFGWGLLNAERAADLVERDGDLGGEVYVQERTLTDGGTIEYTVSSEGDTSLAASIAWTDPAATPPDPQLDPSDRILVNDLDVRVEGPSGTRYSPYVLDPSNPSQPATTGDNTRDNTERVYIETPEPGEYTIRITHEGNLEGGSQDVSLVVSGARPDDVVSPPEALKAVPGEQEVILSWNAPSSMPSGYDVYRSTSSFIDTTKATLVNDAQLDGTSTTYTDNSAKNGNAYHYRVVAIDANQNRSLASSKVVALPPPVGPPSEVTVTSEQERSISLSWLETAGEKLAGYVLYRSTSTFENPSDATRLNDALIEGSTTTYTDGGLDRNTAYYYRLAAVDTVGYEGALSAQESGQTLSRLSAPENVKVTSVREDEATVSWSEKTEKRLEGYIVYRSQGSFEDPSKATRLNDAPIEGSTTSYTDSGLTSSSTYYYRVSAVDTVGNEGVLSKELSLTTAPTSPVSLQASLEPADAESEQVRLQWEAPSPSPSAYRVYRAPEPFESREGGKVVSGPIEDTSYTDSDVSVGQEYHYRVSSLGEEGAAGEERAESRLSGETRAVPENPPPTVPVGATASADDTGITVSWEENSESDLRSYYVYRRTEPLEEVASLTPYDTTEAGSSSFLDESVEEGTAYYYRVTAVDESGGESNPSNVVSSFLYPESVRAAIERSFDEAEGPSDYRLVALPGADKQSLSAVIDGKQGKDWQAYRDNGDEFVKYTESDPFALKPGSGVWLTSTEDWTYDESIPTFELKGDTVATLDLRDGWNVISNPLDKDVAWSEVERATESDLGPLWTFRGTFDSTSTFASAAQGQAYYLFNEESGPDSLIVPYPGAPETGNASPGKMVSEHGRSEAAASKESPVLTLTASTGDGVSSKVSVELAESGSRGEAVIAPPGRFEPVSLRIRDPDAESERSDLLMTDWRSLEDGGTTIALRLRSRLEGPVKISVEGLQNIGVQEARILRTGASKIHDLREEPVITIRPGADEYVKPKLSVGTEEYVKQKAEEVLPAELSLTAYPNPVQRQGTIEYALPEASEVTLEVYDVLGREVATLEQGRRQAGRHRVTLETERLSSGIYFGRLKAMGQTLTRKITVVR